MSQHCYMALECLVRSSWSHCSWWFLHLPGGQGNQENLTFFPPGLSWPTFPTQAGFSPFPMGESRGVSGAI